MVISSLAAAPLLVREIGRPLGVITEGFPVTGKDSVALHNFAGTVKVKLGATPGSVIAGSSLERARRGQGPTLIDAVTYRIGGHSSTAPDWPSSRGAKPIGRGTRTIPASSKPCEPIRLLYFP